MTEPKNEVVISGVGAMFPESDNLDELKELLFNKINGVKDNRFKSVSSNKENTLS
jgi:acyl transferase domain-containing protein